MSTENFYSDLPSFKNFLDITDSERFVSVPDDWYILITDIVGSTKAIEAGRYKDVNLIGACCIIAILNIAGEREVPFIFGGDGASILIPPSLLVEAKQALLGTQYFAKQEFNMDLRLGIVPVLAVTEAKYEVKIAKLKVSDTYSQGIFTGGGLTYATQLTKDSATAKIYNIKNIGIPDKADFSGLNCPWEDILSQHGEIVSLMVMATVNDSQKENYVYRAVLEEIYQIYGRSENFHPVIPENLRLTLKNKNIYSMVKINGQHINYLQKFVLVIVIKIKMLIGAVLMRLKIKLGKVDWELSKNGLVANTDYRKFDDLLRMIISGNMTQREKLVTYLEKNYRAGKLVYGIHVSDRVLMTCLVPVGVGREVHLVDGADGGYALAAKDMKARINLASK
ncbi:DUF3095 domain-containing protein [Argonema antarcticum]|uniref:DUF3095 domain-containing protein n=1 Tax=Argonema antarcticum TaxID=2942763 RepID=UPI002012EDF0|nr:DUF3095 domain-containing protein [Argonema antarcticum]MCL1473410.1 DUF3095 domain-containing protein [Argonema antarcticum A004/B2]